MPRYFLKLFFLLLASSAWAGAEPSPLREKLQITYGIEALDKTDEHSPAVLENLLLLLNKGLPGGFLHGWKNLRYVFAYAGHDKKVDMGAFHPEAAAISIGGKSIYGAGSSAAPDVEVLATLAHEIGHAFLWEKLSPAILLELGEKFGGWPAVAFSDQVASWYAASLLEPHPLASRLKAHPKSGEGSSEWSERNLCSQLASKNLHEWFADAFAAAALQRLGKAGVLGAAWKLRLANAPVSKKEYWTNYNFISGAFSLWLEHKMREPSK